MGEVAERQHQLATARANFLKNGNLARCDVPNHVAASWRRSASYGVQPHELATVYCTELNLESRLVRCAEQVVEHLSQQIAGIPISVALTDKQARILSRRDSNSWIGRKLDRVHFAQGFDYAEGSVGTNGVGTVLEFGESLHIVGGEHYVETLQSFACAGAPVHDPFTGRIEGVLDISCLSDYSTPIMHSLVRSAARQIENNLLRDRNQTQRALFDAYSRLDARSRQAVLAVGPQVVMTNSSLQVLLDPCDRETLQDHMRFLMPRHTTVDEQLDLPSGIRVRLRGSTVQVGTKVAGMIGVVSDLQEIDSSTGTMFQNGGKPSPAENAPRTSMVKSHSPAWRAAAATVETAMRTADSVLLLGEPGSGRCTLATESHRYVHDTDQVVALKAEEVEEAPAEATNRLLETASGRPTLHILQDIDRLSPHVLETLADALGRSRGKLQTLAATASEEVGKQVDHQRLLAAFSTSVTVPSLRHRGADLPVLVRSLLAELAPHRDVHVSKEALRLLNGYHWPDNVRQLKQALSAALTRRPVGAIAVSDLPAFCQSSPRSLLRPVDELERDAIVVALREAGGNRVAAACTLGIARSTLYRKIRQYGIVI